jgi:hypothetical protein
MFPGLETDQTVSEAWIRDVKPRHDAREQAQALELEGPSAAKLNQLLADCDKEAPVDASEEVAKDVVEEACV